MSLGKEREFLAGFPVLRGRGHIGAHLVTADLRFADAVSPNEHGGTVVNLTDYAKTRL